MLLAWQWGILLTFGLLFFIFSPLANSKESFFRAESVNGKSPNFWILTSSLVISWIFAKSITVASDLGLAYGIVGGLAYATYYLSFLVCGILIYRMRTKGGYVSIHSFLKHKYGKHALLLFSLLIGFRLFNEIWSNSMVIGSYFGDVNSTGYYLSIIVFTGLTVSYVLKGGMNTSMRTDFIQMILFGVLLIILLVLILPSTGKSVNDYLNSGTWSFSNGVNLILVALLQVFSYPFHDPVLTDRAFIAPPKITLKSFLVATVIGFGCILLFSLIGVSASFRGITKNPAAEMSKYLGVLPVLLMNVIMITSAASTLDSTFSSFSKMVVIDQLPKRFHSLSLGRITMLLLAIFGTIPVFLAPEILSATTISGTMVIGLAPIFLCWRLNPPVLSYYLSIGTGIIFGLLVATGNYPSKWLFTQGKYADLLSANTIGLVLCFIVFLLPLAFVNGKENKRYR